MSEQVSPTGGSFKLLTEGEIADRLRVSRRHLQNLNYSGKGPPYISLGRRKLYPDDRADAWLREQIVTPTP